MVKINCFRAGGYMHVTQPETILRRMPPKTNIKPRSLATRPFIIYDSEYYHIRRFFSIA